MRVLRTGALAVWIATAYYLVCGLIVGFEITYPDKDISTWTRLMATVPIVVLGITLGCGLWGFAEVLRTRPMPSPPPRTDDGDRNT